MPFCGMIGGRYAYVDAESTLVDFQWYEDHFPIEVLLEHALETYRLLSGE